jgi:serine/threonine protein kinase
MHDRGIIHGDLRVVRFQISQSPFDMQFTVRKANILIDNDGHPRLTGFRLVTPTSEQPTATPLSLPGGSTPRMSPENAGLKTTHPTKESDCYALGVVIYEVLSQVPFVPRSSFWGLATIRLGKHPKRPHGNGGRLFTDEIWDTLKRCWKEEPRDRPSAEGVLVCLERNLPPLTPPGGMKTGASGQ